MTHVTRKQWALAFYESGIVVTALWEYDRIAAIAATGT
jgi:hypothetical protein